MKDRFFQQGKNLQPRAALITKILVRDNWRSARRASVGGSIVLRDMQIAAVDHAAGILLKYSALFF